MFIKSIDIERQLKVMKAHELNAEEWLVTELLMMALDDPQRSSYLIVYFNECKKERMPLELLKSLQEKRVLSSKSKLPTPGETFRLENLELSGTFKMNYFKGALEAGEELLEAYPKLVPIGGVMRSLTNITKGGYQHQEDFFAQYNKNIRYSREKHEGVLDILSWAIENKLIHYGIVEYVTTKKWEEHQKMRDSGDIGGFVLRVNTLEDI